MRDTLKMSTVAACKLSHSVSCAIVTSPLSAGTRRLHLRAAAVALLALGLSAAGGPAFQDEVREAAAGGRRALTGAAAHSGFQVGLAGADSSGGAATRGALYAEPFALSRDDAGVHALLDLAIDRTVALARVAEPGHDGRLRGQDVRA